VSIGLDTSVVLRLLTGEPAAEARLARGRIERAHAAAEPVIVTDLVLAEAYFALFITTTAWPRKKHVRTCAGWLAQGS
jgi:predicted nucleic acid-binding protein